MTTPTPGTSAIRAGSVLSLTRGLSDRDGDIAIERVEQRNWSRVGVGRSRAGNEAFPVFVKQFVDRRGRWHPAQLENEQRGASFAARHLPSVRVPELLGRDDTTVALVYEFVPLRSIGDLLRREPGVVEAAWTRVCDELANLLRDLEHAADVEGVAGADLPQKSRPYPTQGMSVVLKGLDVRNIGVPDGASITSDRLWLFDPGHPYLAPREEAAAKIAMSLAFVNWGWPITRFASGPPFDLLDDLAERIDGRLEVAALRHELQRETRGRLSEPLAASTVGRAGKRIVMSTIGLRYRTRLRRWLELQTS